MLLRYGERAMLRGCLLWSAGQKYVPAMEEAEVSRLLFYVQVAYL